MKLRHQGQIRKGSVESYILNLNSKNDRMMPHLLGATGLPRIISKAGILMLGQLKVKVLVSETCT